MLTIHQAASGALRCIAGSATVAAGSLLVIAMTSRAEALTRHHCFAQRDIAKFTIEWATISRLRRTRFFVS